MSDDLVKRLRDCEFMGMPDARLDYSTAHEAADRIEELEAQVRAADALVQKGSTLALRLAHIVGREDIIIVWDQALKAYHAAKEGGA